MVAHDPANGRILSQGFQGGTLESGCGHGQTRSGPSGGHLAARAARLLL